MSEEDVKNIMQKYGKYDLKIKEYQRFKADKTKTETTKQKAHLSIYIYYKKVFELIQINFW